MTALLSSVYNLKIPTPQNTEIIGGWAGEQLDKLSESITTGIYNGFISVIDAICEVSFWCAKAGVIGCIIVFISSHDKKAISIGMKLLIIYIIISVVRLNI